jgi:hypothetical protein
MSAPKASCLPSAKAKEAVRYVIGTVLDFNPVDDCPLWLAMINDATDESRVKLYNQWLWLTPDDILTLQYHPEPSKHIREENLLQMVLWKTVHFALFLVKISINFSHDCSTVFFF